MPYFVVSFIGHAPFSENTPALTWLMGVPRAPPGMDSPLKGGAPYPTVTNVEKNDRLVEVSKILKGSVECIVASALLRQPRIVFLWVD